MINRDFANEVCVYVVLNVVVAAADNLISSGTGIGGAVAEVVPRGKNCGGLAPFQQSCGQPSKVLALSCVQAG